MDDFSRVLESIPRSRIREFFDLVSGGEDMISLGVGEPDFATPWTIRDEAIYAIEKGFTSYTSNQGLPELCKEIVAYLARRFSVRYDAKKEVLVTNGVSEGADIVLRALLNPGDEVILPQPVYVCYDPLIRLAGGVVVPLDTAKTKFVPDPAEIEKRITSKTKAIVLCYPNNPTGMTISKSVLSKIAKIADKHNLWVISDEIYAELSFDEPCTSFSALPGMKERTILMNGFSKAFAMTGWRIAYLCGPESIISRATKIHQYSALCASRISQVAAIEALRNGESEMLKMVKSYKERRNFFVAGLNELGLKTLIPDGAFYCFPSIKSTGMSSGEFAKKLIEAERVAVIPGDAFGVGGEGYVRCCYATAPDDLKEALKRIGRFLKTVKK